MLLLLLRFANRSLEADSLQQFSERQSCTPFLIYTVSNLPYPTEPKTVYVLGGQPYNILTLSTNTAGSYQNILSRVL